ncbi:uncharacterized protein LOC117164350 [Bombus vancouverensis nearcticus]|uniref:uncharacterized protein LOC117164350 n=1 Tax=Bombus vancouverensis nearcticus TaxID=2705178 RepID=UPI00143BD7F2|nr:uncharacterized protein LOC117164350 [Bombus vancouverensis nearcticus]
MTSKKVLLRKETFLERLLKEGKGYIFTMEELHVCLKRHSCEYKKMLFVIDRYSRYKTQLKENMEDLIVYDSDVLDDNDDEDIEDADEMEYLDIEMGGYENEEDFVVFEEYFHNFDSIAYRRNILANMEMLILRMLIMDGSLINILFSIYSKLKILLKDYYQRVEKFLERNKTLVEFQNNSEKKQPIKSFEKKYNQLQQLLLKITEKEIFLVETMVQPRMVQNNGENKNN